jgi:hypothetical protein
MDNGVCILYIINELFILFDSLICTVLMNVRTLPMYELTLYVCTSMYTVYMYVCMYVYMYVCIYTTAFIVEWAYAIEGTFC